MTNVSFHLLVASPFPGKPARRSWECSGRWERAKTGKKKAVPAESGPPRRAGVRSTGPRSLGGGRASCSRCASSLQVPELVSRVPSPLRSRWPLTGLSKSRVRGGGRGCGQAAANPLGVPLQSCSKKLPEQAKSRRRDLLGKRQSAASRVRGFTHCPAEVDLVCNFAQGQFY